MITLVDNTYTQCINNVQNLVKNKITETSDSARVFLDNNLNLLIRTVLHLIRRKLMEEAIILLLIRKSVTKHAEVGP